MEKNEVIAELKRRGEILDKNLEKNSQSRNLNVLFYTALAPLGNPPDDDDDEKWRDDSMNVAIMSEEEFHLDVYDDVMMEIFNKLHSTYQQLSDEGMESSLHFSLSSGGFPNGANAV